MQTHSFCNGQSYSIAVAGRLHHGVEHRILINGTLSAHCPFLIVQLTVAIVLWYSRKRRPHESMGIVNINPSVYT